MDRKMAMMCILGIGIAVLSLGCMQKKGTMNVETSNHEMTAHIETDGSESETHADISCDVVNYGDPGYATVRGYIERLMQTNPDRWEVTDEGEKRVHLDQNEKLTLTFSNLLVYDVNKQGSDEVRFNFEVTKEEPD